MLTIDALTSPTLKHLRDAWWDDEFTEFLTETLRPRPGNRILDVGCDSGAAEVRLGRLHISQLGLYGVDIDVQKVATARREAAGHNLDARYAAGDARRLPFADQSFDSTYCVAVLQLIHDVQDAVREFARVTRDGGRILAVEPDNAARYSYSSTASGAAAFALAKEFFAAAQGESTEPAIGPRLPALFASCGIEPVMVRLFPVSYARLEAPPPEVWEARRAAVDRACAGAGVVVREIGQRYRAALDAYERETRAANGVFVEIQNTMLFATVGQRNA